jgi:hypothetical protein
MKYHAKSVVEGLQSIPRDFFFRTKKYFEIPILIITKVSFIIITIIQVKLLI